MYSYSTVAQSGITAFLLALCAAMPVRSQTESERPAVEVAAEALVAEALDANLQLAAIQAGVAGRSAALDEARARLLPAIDLQLRYSRADGGREIEFPVGDLLNPAYASLNTLLAAAGQPAPFSPIDNRSFNFLRQREQDSVLRLAQPLYDARLAAAKRAALHDHAAARLGLEAFRAKLTRDVRQAYYRWLATRAAIEIRAAALDLASENERVNDSLYRHGQVTRDLVLRAETGRLEAADQLLRARNTAELARRYVNLLCNAPLERPLQTVEFRDADLPRLAARIRPPARATPLPAAFEVTALDQRAELEQLAAGLDAAAERERAAQSAFRPRLAFALDAGTQGAEWDYGDQDPYVMASLIVRFNFWSGGADRAALRAARAHSAELAAGRALVEQQIRAEVRDALSDLELAEAILATANRRVDAAAAAFAIVARKRDLGQVPPAEYLAAQSALTEARIQRNVSRFDVLGALAQVEYAVGSTEQMP